MVIFIVRRCLLLLPTLLGVTLVAFALTSLSGDPTTAILPPEASDAQRQAFREAHGLDRPWLVRYFEYVGRLSQGDLGTSLSQQVPVASLIARRLPATVQLAFAALVLVIVVGIPLGVISAVYRGGPLDYLVRLIALVWQSVATFWLGMMLILLFSVRLGLLPPSGRDSAASLVLPAVTLAAYMTAVIVRMTRSGMLDVLNRDYIRTARGKGLARGSINYKHALRNALIPVVTVLGVQLGHLLSGAIVTETIFAWPGLGSLIVDSVYRRDHEVVQAAVVIMAVWYVLVNLLTDLLYGVINPRIRIA